MSPFGVALNALAQNASGVNTLRVLAQLSQHAIQYGRHAEAEHLLALATIAHLLAPAVPELAGGALLQHLARDVEHRRVYFQRLHALLRLGTPVALEVVVRMLLRHDVDDAECARALSQAIWGVAYDGLHVAAWRQVTDRVIAARVSAEDIVEVIEWIVRHCPACGGAGAAAALDEAER